MDVLVIDIGGSHVTLALPDRDRAARFDSGPDLRPDLFVQRVSALTQGWSYDAISLGYPGRVGPRGPTAEPGNLGPGWVGYDFSQAFGKPVRIVNDAVLQALGAYDGGRMLFFGLGTGLGTALVSERVIVPLELGDLPDLRGETLGARLGQRALERDEEDWQQAVFEAATALRPAFLADYVMLGGGNASQVDPLPPLTRRGGNDDAIHGGHRLWRESMQPHDDEPPPFWRVVA
jgi:polyphosphate glucokinase